LNIGEIYEITYKKKGYEDTTLHINTQKSILLTQSELDIEMIPSKSHLILQIVDADSLHAIVGLVDIRNRDKDEDLTNMSNDPMQHIVRARQGDTYVLYVRAKGYVYKDTLFQIPYLSDTLIHTIPLTALRKEMVLQLRNIQFDHNSSALTPSSYEELDKLVKLMQDNPSMQIELSAHTDDLGSEQYNLRLSQKRGEAAKKYLQRQGIEAQRIIAKGYGKNKPLVPNDSDENRAINRRVEFTINEIEIEQ
jgi:outer membrane protein OmpA-like peptidoglycan-associated protein